MILPHSGSYYLLPTEQPNPRTRDIDLDSSLRIVQRINREDRRVASAVGREVPRVARAVDVIVSALRSGGKLIFVGAGTSGRLGVLEAAECPPTFGTPARLVQAVMAGGRASVFRSKEGAEDDPKDGARQVRGRARRGDVVVGIAASGVTPFVNGALRAAGRLGCRTVLVTSNTRLKIPGAEVVISPNVGPEVIAGSTRLKSGTAAKMILNLLTTAAMIRRGKVYDRWMVDLKPTSRKLNLRAVRIICDLGRVDESTGKELMKCSGGKVAVAVLAAWIKKGALMERVRRARKLLAEQGSLRRALGRVASGQG